MQDRYDPQLEMILSMITAEDMTALTLSFPPLSDENAKRIASAIEESTHLVKLTFDKCNFTPEQTTIITNALYKNQALIECNFTRIALRKAGVIELAQKWIEYKDLGAPLTRLLKCFEKYAYVIPHVLSADLKRSDLSKLFNQDYEMQKSAATFWVAYGITKNVPECITVDISNCISVYLKYSDIQYDKAAEAEVGV